MRRFVTCGVVLLALVGLSLPAFGARQATPGVTPKLVTIGGTFPLTGPASLYAPIPAAMKAYFSYVNTRRGPDGKRGVYGRQIDFVYLDDGYNPANTVQLTRQLVEQTKVFAIVGTLGTEPNLAIRPYLNRNKVPQLLVATGATTWGRDWKTYPWTGGWQPDYELEARIYGQSIARNAGRQKIAVLYQNDDYGNDYLRGLKAGLGGKASNIVAAEPYEVTASDVKSQVAKLRASGATVFCIFATPKFTIQAYVIAKALGWNPPVIYTNSVSGTANFLTLAQKSGAGALVDNTYTVQYAKDPASPRWANDPAMKLYRQVLARFAPQLKPDDALNLYGVAVAEAFVELLQKAGPNPTREGLMKAYRSWNQANPFLIPGIRQHTDAKNQFPIRGEVIVKFGNGVFTPVSGLKVPA
ncbi:MAG TPA: ABC transporter substrate-binding protein [Gaiellaceae bacterium]|nr:ABC transporter substrate-binding protein [Gaiellaceae bacterium]